MGLEPLVEARRRGRGPGCDGHQAPVQRRDAAGRDARHEAGGERCRHDREDDAASLGRRRAEVRGRRRRCADANHQQAGAHLAELGSVPHVALVKSDGRVAAEYGFDASQPARRAARHQKRCACCDLRTVQPQRLPAASRRRGKRRRGRPLRHGADDGSARPEVERDDVGSDRSTGGRSLRGIDRGICEGDDHIGRWQLVRLGRVFRACQGRSERHGDYAGCCVAVPIDISIPDDRAGGHDADCCCPGRNLGLPDDERRRNGSDCGAGCEPLSVHDAVRRCFGLPDDGRRSAAFDDDANCDHCQHWLDRQAYVRRRQLPAGRDEHLPDFGERCDAADHADDNDDHHTGGADFDDAVAVLRASNRAPWAAAYG